MHFAVHNWAFSPATATHLRRSLLGAGVLVSSELRDERTERRRRALKRVDGELLRRNYKAALSLVKQLQGKPGGLRGFGSAKQVPQRVSSLDELNAKEIDISSLKSLVVSVLDSIKRSMQFALLDEVSVKRLENFSRGESKESQSEKDYLMCKQHEAGHFLVGYLLGVLPRQYNIPTKEAINVDIFSGGRVEFVGFEFLSDVGTRAMLEKNIDQRKACHREHRSGNSSTTLNRFSCVMLGGLVAEHLTFGYSEGLHSDVEKLDRVLRWSGFSQDEADSQVKWAVLNTILLLQRHESARLRLAEAMASRRSVGFCIETVENAIKGEEI